MSMLQPEKDGRQYAKASYNLYRKVKPAQNAVRCPACDHIYMRSIATFQPDYCPKCFKCS